MLTTLVPIKPVPPRTTILSFPLVPLLLDVWFFITAPACHDRRKSVATACRYQLYTFCMTAFEDLSLLRAFISIVECGSISAGARRLRITQPTLSRQLKTLEERCGMALLRRDTHQMSLTEAGHRVLADGHALLAQVEAADKRLRESHTTLSGHLRLFATIDFGQFGATRMISQFLLAHPKVSAP